MPRVRSICRLGKLESKCNLESETHCLNNRLCETRSYGKDDFEIEEVHLNVFNEKASNY